MPWDGARALTAAAQTGFETRMGHTLFAAEPLGQWAAALLMRHGVAAADATVAAQVLLRTSLRGIDTHGISRLPAYVERLRAGDVNATPSIGLQ